jgi:hypothetical protein
MDFFAGARGNYLPVGFLDVHTVTPPNQTLERRTPPISKYTVDTPTKDFRSAVDGLLLSFPFISSASTCFTLPCRCFPFLYPKNRSSRYPHHLSLFSASFLSHFHVFSTELVTIVIMTTDSFAPVLEALNVLSSNVKGDSKQRAHDFLNDFQKSVCRVDNRHACH